MKMLQTRADLEQLIQAKVEEGSNLDYKAADAVGRSDGKKREITKDVSSFANAAGGTIIYGISEFGDPALRHFPERIDAINGSDFTKEWFDQIIGLIQPRIEVVIAPIRVGPNESDVCFVVTIPQGSTAHQAIDYRYYKRRNFEATAMEDYEIRDVMNRRKYPTVAVAIRVATKNPDRSRILVRVENTSRVIARDYAVYLEVPIRMRGVFIHPKDTPLESRDGKTFWKVSFHNGLRPPLFPGAVVHHSVDLSVGGELQPDPGETVDGIRVTVFADEMERLEIVKSSSDALEKWT